MTERRVTIRDAALRRDGDADVLSATFVFDGRRHPMWFRSADVRLADTADAFFAVGLILAMRLGSELEVEAPVSPRLLRGAPRIQEVLGAWQPEALRQVDVLAQPREDAATYGERGAAAFFTGGVDSSYTLLKHLRNGVEPVYVEGYDLPGPSALQTEVVARLGDAAAGLGRRLLRIHTNLRSVVDPIAEWRLHAHGAALAAAGLAMAPRFREILIAATRSYRRLIPSGSHAVLDPLFSTEDVEIIHDGAERTRFEKIQWHASDGRALQWLRVCWQNYDGAYNCGRCSKCLRTMLMLRAAGALARCETFATPLQLTNRTWVPDNRDRDLEETYLHVSARGHDLPLARVLRKCVTPSPRWRRALQRLRRQLAAARG